MTQQLSDMFEYEECILHTVDVVFRNVTLVEDLVTYKGTYEKGTVFSEVYLEFPSLLMTFLRDDPNNPAYGEVTEVEINVRVENDL